MATIVSFGGGVNSTAMLLGMFEHDERPDAILFADTGGEKPGTYDHIDRMQRWCAAVGYPKIETVRQKITLEQDCLDRETLPSKAFGFGTCSERFKIQPQRTWVKEKGWAGQCCWVVGIHYGEQQRASRLVNEHNEPIRYPLIHWQWGSAECLEAIRRHDIDVPCKSACFYCPSSRKREVLQLRDSYPALFARAVDMEQGAKESGNLQTVKGLGRKWSWEALARADAEQMRLDFEDDQAPLCDVCIDG